MYYRQPRYYNTFQCIGGDCADNCCYGWTIDWRKEEVEKLKNAPNISPELREFIDEAFVWNGIGLHEYIVKFDEHKRCPSLTEEGLCRIQKELGAEYLSYTCMHYPRIERPTPGVVYRHMNLSCREIIKRLFVKENACDLINVGGGDDEFSCRVGHFTKEALQKKPELAHYGAIFEFFYELISDKRFSFETAIIFGALAAQKLIEKVIRGGTTALLHDDTGTLNIDLYNEGEQKMKKALKGHEFFLRNLALGLLLEFDIPFYLKENTMFENYSVFAVAFGLLKLNLIATCRADDGEIEYRTDGQKFVYSGEDKIIGITAIICRHICQDSGKEELVIKLLRTFNFTTPAYLALLIK